jgi:hypothetical protein
MNKLSSLDNLAVKSFDASNTYSDKVHFVHIYSVEAHPLSPDPSPYSGEVWELAYSTKPQVRTYPERVAYAATVEPYRAGTQLVLADELTPLPRNNPVWSSYGPCSNGAYLIGMDGRIKAAQLWQNTNDLETAIDSLFP